MKEHLSTQKVSKECQRKKEQKMWETNALSSTQQSQHPINQQNPLQTMMPPLYNA